jgi:hypothetical protein
MQRQFLGLVMFFVLPLLTTCKRVGTKQTEQSGLSIISGGNRSYSIQGEGISVCYRQSTANTDWKDVDALNAAVKSAVEDEWGAKVGVKTHGWKPCAGMPTAQLEINFFDCGDDKDECPDKNSSPHVAFIGPPASGQTNVVNLRRTYENHYRFDECNGLKTILGVAIRIHSETKSRERCTRNYAVHEFGHILGFDHEQYHPDGPPECNGDKYHFAKTGLNAAKWLCSKGYDDESVMNYCGKSFLNWDAGLSAKDVQCAKEFFKGRP